MNLATILGLALATSTTTVASRPAWLAEATNEYKACLYSAIDRQNNARLFSEKNVISECAGVRRDQVRKAELAATKALAPRERKSLIAHEFARLDSSVWTIVGHLREQHGIPAKVS